MSGNNGSTVQATSTMSEKATAKVASEKVADMVLVRSFDAAERAALSALDLPEAEVKAARAWGRGSDDVKEARRALRATVGERLARLGKRVSL